MSSIGERLEKIRINLAITGKSFAEILEITPQGYINYSKNKRDIPISIVLKINQMFNISLDWLLTGKGDMLQNNESKISIPNKLGSNISEKEIEILEAYKKLNQKKQKLYYHQILADAAQAEIEADESNTNIVKDVKSAV